MRLLFAHENFGDFGGAETFVYLTGSELKERGHGTSLLYRQSTGRNESQWRQTFRESYCLSTPGNRETLEAVLERAQPEVVFVNNWNDLETLGALLDSGVPVVRMVHDHSLYCMRGYKYNYFTRKICTRPASGHCVFPCLGPVVRNAAGPLPLKWASYEEKKREIGLNRRCTAVLAYSEYQKRELVGNGFDAEKIHLTTPMRVTNIEGLTSTFSDRNLILFVGQVIRGKGVDALMRALAKVRGRFECLVVGDGNHRSKCERLAGKLGLGEKVKFQGYVLPGQLKQYYLEATVFAMSSLWPEPFGMAGPEAMRYGLPVVAFEAGAIGEWLKDGDNGFLVRWNDTDAFAERLSRLLNDKDLAREMGRRASASIQRFDYGGQIDALERLFGSVCRAPATKAAGVTGVMGVTGVTGAAAGVEAQL